MQPTDLDESRYVSDISYQKGKSLTESPVKVMGADLETNDESTKLLKTLIINYNKGKDSFSLQDIQTLFECTKIHAEIYIEELLDEELINKIASSSHLDKTYELNSSAKRLAISRGWI
ncbi:hypothetical protein [Umboniibacter marinipuniceus]|uniref:Uncharacterized protein n=1 Tax=Umboniibacter marinipuniceus TaxID=569599 RepID=A0A3M0AJD8_9GAMM|nr:hypothetical protein [Umboniibacter marinipuniceus]RMA82685.1 hypothetical protein DFR27_0638 [Umboniibacter marinipuniceus]